MDFIKNNYKKFIFSLIINILICIFFNILFYCRFHTVDDVFMEMIVCGGYGKTDVHLIFINSILGSILKILYDITNNISWYALMHISFSILSFSTITYVFLNRNIKVTRILIWLAIFFASYEAYTKIQFTKTAAYLAAAGFVVIAYSFETYNRRKHQILGIVLLWFSSMVRIGMFLGCSAICLSCLIPKLINYFKDIEQNRKDIINLITVGAVSLVLLIGSIAIDKASYKSNGWEKYIEYNNCVTQLQDVCFPDYEKYKDGYTKLGITYDDYALYRSLEFNDPDNFGIEVMKKVTSFQKYEDININEIYLFVIRGIKNIFEQTTTGTFTYLIILLVIYFFISKSNTTDKTISLIYEFVVSCFAFTYTYYMHGWFDRTSISILFVALISVLYLINPKRFINEKIVKIACIVVILLCITVLWKDKLKINQQKVRDDFIYKQTLISEITNDSNHLYLCRSSFSLRKNFYMAYDRIEKGTCENFHPLGDWVSNTPLSIECLKKYNVINPYKDIINNDKVYLIGNEGDFEIVINYIKSNFDSSVYLEKVNMLGEYCIYCIRYYNN